MSPCARDGRRSVRHHPNRSSRCARDAARTPMPAGKTFADEKPAPPDRHMFKPSVLIVALVFPAVLLAHTAAGQAPGLPRPPGAASAGQAVRRLLVGLDANPKTSSNYKRGDWEDSIALMHTAGVNQYHY